MDFTENGSAAAVVSSFAETPDPRVPLSDVLGASMLVETVEAERRAEHATASTVLGPFHVAASPARELGDSIDLVGEGEPCLVEGRVLDPEGRPLGNGRGLFTADARGRYWFRSVVPAHYPVPTDGPVGRLLQATNRHPFRPAHIHLLVEAPGHVPLTTHVFVAGSPYLDSDAVFAVKQSLVCEFAVVDDPSRAAALGLPDRFRRARFDVVVEPADGREGASS